VDNQAKGSNPIGHQTKSKKEIEREREKLEKVVGGNICGIVLFFVFTGNSSVNFVFLFLYFFVECVFDFIEYEDALMKNCLPILYNVCFLLFFCFWVFFFFEIFCVFLRYFALR